MARRPAECLLSLQGLGGLATDVIYVSSQVIPKHGVHLLLVLREENRYSKGFSSNSYRCIIRIRSILE